MFSKKLLGTLVLIAAAVGVPGSATARGSERAVGSFSADETGILAATSLDSAVTSDQEALGTRAGGEVGARVHILAVRIPGSPGARIHILAPGTTHSAARRDIDYIDDALGSGLRGTTDRQH
jgi:hypothetical protein